MMQLNNVIGLCGVLMLLQLINCMELETNFLTACVLLVLSDCDRKVKAIVPKLFRKNPMVTFTDNSHRSHSVSDCVPIQLCSGGHVDVEMFPPC